MARNYSNLASSRSEYARALPGAEGGFRGVDFSSSPHRVALYRLPDAQNMYRDYRSEEGGALETIPGFRQIKKLDGRINGLYRYDTSDGTPYIAAHAGTKLYLCCESERDTGTWVQVSGDLADSASSAFVYNNTLYLLDGTSYKKLKKTGDAYFLVEVSAEAYAPKRYLYGEEYEQRNALTDKYRTVVQGATGTPAAEEPQDKYDTTAHRYIGGNTFVYSNREGILYPVVNAGVKVVVLSGSNGVYGTFDADESITDVALVPGGTGVSTAAVNGYLSQLNALKRLYFLCNDADGATFYFTDTEGVIRADGGNVFFDFPLSEFQKRFAAPTGASPSFQEKALEILPPNIVVKAGGAVATGDLYSVKSISGSGSVGCYYSKEISVGTSQSTDTGKISIYSNTDGYVCVSAGADVAPGRYYLLSDITHTRGYAKPRLYRIEVVAADTADEDMPKPVQDVFEFAGRALTFQLPDKTDEVYSVMDGEREAGWGYIKDDAGNIVAVGVIAPASDNDIEITASAGTYRFRTGQDALEPLNPDYDGSIKDAITKCRLCAIYDDRIFLAGNPDFPNSVFYSARNDAGVNDPSYFGVLNYFNDGIGWERVTALFPFSDVLCVTKADTVYYHQGADGTDVVTRVYPSVRGNAGLGSLGACCNFLDDPVMLTAQGVFGVNKETLTLERTLGRRSSTIDARLLREQNLNGARMVEWEGYLCLFVNGHVYMADSRASYQDATGGVQYEWFYLCDVGVWRNANGLSSPIYAAVTGDLSVDGVSLAGERISQDGTSYVLTETHDELYFSDDEVFDTEVNGVAIKYAILDGKAYAVYATGELAKEGVFHPAVCPMVVGDRLYFGTDTGEVFVFNNDKRGVSVGDDEVEPSELHHSFYHFAWHRIDSGFLTRFDDCGVPHLCKSTSSRSLTVRVKVMGASVFSVCVSTERKRDRHMDDVTTEGFSDSRREHLVGDVSASRFGFAGVDFSALSFMVQTNATVVVPERERRWVEKQYLLRDGGFCRPFGVYNITYRYRIAGRIRE